MRVVHLSTYDVDGGAARAAFRLHESLLGANQLSSMVVRTRHSNASTVHEALRPSGTEALLGDLVQKYYIAENRTSLSTTWFSLGWPAEDLSSHPEIQNADVIHLHWVTGLVSPSSLELLLRLNKPIVWTLHDQRAYTGGCHYTAGCHEFETGCQTCAQLRTDPCRLPAANLADQMQFVARAGITVVAPSRWMAQCAGRSSVFANSRIEVIPYGIDLNRFQALPQAEARAKLVLPEDSLLLLFGVDNALEKRKGLGELFSVLQACGKDAGFAQVAHCNPSLLCFGDINTLPQLPIPIRSFGRIRSDEVLNSLYSAADLFLLPSLEDNLPNTVLESLASGTPVGAFDTGGVPDMVVQGQTGFLVTAGDLQGFRRLIVDSARNLQGLRDMRGACRRHVETHFTYDRQARAYLALYEDLLKKAQRLPSRSSVSGNSHTFTVGPNFEHIVAPLLKHVFDQNPEVPLSPGQQSVTTRNKDRRGLNRRIKRILKRAVRNHWRDTRLKASLQAELAIWEGARVGPTRIKLFLRRLLRSS